MVLAAGLSSRVYDIACASCNLTHNKNETERVENELMSPRLDESSRVSWNGRVSDPSLNSQLLGNEFGVIRLIKLKSYNA